MTAQALRPFVFKLGRIGDMVMLTAPPWQVRRIRRLLRLSGIDSRRCLFIAEAPGAESPWLDALLRFARQTPSALSAAGYPEPAGDWSPRLRVLEAERTERDRWLRARGFRGEPLIIVQPGNHRTMGRRRLRNWRGRDDKVWPVEHWVRLLHKLHARMPDAMLMIRGAAAEVPLLESIRAATGLTCVTSASTALRPLFALCEVAHSMISVDSGPAHSAAALGVPLVVLYGIQSPRVWLPCSADDAPILAVGGPPAFERAEQISVDAVYAAWRSLVDRTSPGQAAAQADLEPPPAPLSSQMTSVRIEPSALSSSVR